MTSRSGKLPAEDRGRLALRIYDVTPIKTCACDVRRRNGVVAVGGESSAALMQSLAAAVPRPASGTGPSD